VNTAAPFSLDFVAAERRSIFNPLVGLTPQALLNQIDQYRAGYLRALAVTMDAMEERDDLLASVVPKAKAAPTIHGWEINTVDVEDEAAAKEAARQKEVLEEFYNNLRATSALDQDQLGGVELLLEQMMDAKAKRYSVHNIVWKSLGSGRYTATFWHTPLWFFENTTGKLRFLKNSTSINGEDLEPGAWLTTVYRGFGIMVACAICCVLKRAPLRDWATYCGRHGLPGFEGVTDAEEGSKEWKLLWNAVRSAAAGEFAWVRSRNQEINKIDFGAEGELPHPPLVEAMNRAMTAIWRGADLSTISSSTPDARGSQLQGEEADIIEAKDAQWLSGQLNMRVDRLVLDYVFGPNTPQLAYFKVLTAQKQNIELDLQIDEFALAHGHPVSQQQFAERYNRPLPGAEDTLLVAAAAPAPDPNAPAKIPAINEAQKQVLKIFMGRAKTLLGTAFASTMEPILSQLRAAINGPDDEFVPAMRALNERLPAYLDVPGIDAPTRAAFLKIFSTAFFNGLTDK
jgi:hypothetical protein